jgi:hypothetical protein
MVNPACINLLKTTAIDVTSQQITDALLKKTLSTPDGVQMAQGAQELAVLARSVPTGNYEANALIASLSREAMREMTSSLSANSREAQNRLAELRAQDEILKNATLQKPSVSSRLANELLGLLSPEERSDFSRIKNAFVRSMIDTAFSSACTGNAYTGNLTSFFSQNTSMSSMYESQLMSSQTALLKTPLVEYAMTDPAFVNALRNEVQVRDVESMKAMESVILANSLDVGFNELTSNITSSLPSNTHARASNIPNIVSNATVTNVLVKMGDVPQSSIPVNILADSKRELDKAIISLQKEGSLVTPETISARVKYLNNSDTLPVGVTDGNLQVIAPTLTANINAKADVLNYFPSVPREDGFVLVEQSVTRNIKSPIQMLTDVITNSSNSVAGIQSAMITATTTTTIADSPVTPIIDNATTDALLVAQDEKRMANELSDVLSAIPETPTVKRSYTRLTY